ncbi:MAG TPA: PilZ domain-containing protein [Allosphingosinicella sp.]|jgi:hypothetical protein
MLKPTIPEASEFDRRQARRDARVATVMLAARLIAARGEQLCRIRNISPMGLKVHCDLPLNQGEAIRIELRNGRSVEGRIVWSNPPFAGMQFTARADLNALLATTPEEAAHVARLPRVHVHHPVLVHVGARMLGASIVDLSQGGARLRLRAPLERGAQVTLSVTGGLGTLKGSVRWTKSEEAGVAFNETIPFDTLSRFLAQREG